MLLTATTPRIGGIIHATNYNMSFFGRTAITIAVIAGILHVFRRDVARIVGVLRKPTENFIKEVKKEIDNPAATGAITARSQEGAATGAAEKLSAAAHAAEQVKEDAAKEQTKMQ